MNRLQQLRLNVDYIPAYSPMLAPVEVFFKQLKTKMRRCSEFKKQNLNHQSGYVELCRLILELEGEPIKYSRKECITISKNIISE